MKMVLFGIFFGLLVTTQITGVQAQEIPTSKCQQIAHDFGNDPDALPTERLQQLQYCINQILNQREASNPPAMLKGTIIEPLRPSEERKSTATPGPNE